MVAPISKLAYGTGFTVQEVVGSQNYFGLAMLAIINLLFFRYKVGLKVALSLMGIGITNALTSVFYSQTVHALPAAIAIVFLFQFTWVGIVIEAIALKERPSKGKLLSIPLLLAGTAIAGGIFELGEVNITFWGAFFGFLSAITFSLFIFFSGRVATDVPAINRSLFIILGSAITVSLIFPPRFLVNGAISDGLMLYAIPIALFGIVIAPLFFAKGTPHTGSGLASILGSSELPMAVLMAAIILGEQVSPLRWFGIAVTLLGISLPYLLSYRNRKLQTVQ